MSVWEREVRTWELVSKSFTLEASQRQRRSFRAADLRRESRGCWVAESATGLGCWVGRVGWNRLGAWVNFG
ncbi:hypothetical protein LINPERPRIM_LOCUS9369 [Linum perenne]